MRDYTVGWRAVGRFYPQVEPVQKPTKAHCMIL